MADITPRTKRILAVVFFVLLLGSGLAFLAFAIEQESDSRADYLP